MAAKTILAREGRGAGEGPITLTDFLITVETSGKTVGDTEANFEILVELRFEPTSGTEMQTGCTSL